MGVWKFGNNAPRLYSLFSHYSPLFSFDASLAICGAPPLFAHRK